MHGMAMERDIINEVQIPLQTDGKFLGSWSEPPAQTVENLP